MAEDETKATLAGEGQHNTLRFLEDAPATRDAFGPHERVAEALLRLVEKERGGKAIALIGPWGSGKSTVINLLRQKCEEAHNSRDRRDLGVFVFDAWAHEGDPLRRTFLEQLIARLIGDRWIEHEKWNDRLKELSHRHKLTTTKSKPQLTFVGAAFTALLFLAPIGLAIFGKAKSRHWSLGGLALFSLPLIFLVLVWLGKKPWRRNSEERWALLSLLVTKTAEVTQSETFESPEPTSVEFQECFHDLAREALRPQRKLVIVLDNLDRVGSEDALRLWSAMRTFLDFPEGQPPPWVEKLWTLVPFDDKGIKNLWEREQKIAETFLDKTFQIRFQVPAPLLSDWRSFLSAQLRFVFPHHTDEDAYIISRLYATLCAEKKPPTPRDIKLFVNQIATVNLACPEQIPLPHQALYVAVKLTDQNWAPTSPLPQSEKLQPYLGTDWPQDLAALHFNMPKEKALQVLFGETVEKAIAEGNAELFASIKERPGVDLLVEKTLEQRRDQWSKNEPHILGKVAFALSGAAVPDTVIWQNAWGLLIAEADKRQSWPFLDSASGRGLAALLAHAAYADFAPHLLISLKLIPSAQGEGAEKNLSSWTQGLLEILRGLRTAGYQSILETCRFGQSYEAYVALLSSVSQFVDWREEWRYIRPGFREDVVLDALVETFTSGRAELRFEHACYAMRFVDSVWAWDRLIGAMQTRLQQGAAPLECGVGLRTLFRLRVGAPSAQTALQAIASSGWLFHHIQSANQAGLHETVSACILAAILFDSEATGGPYVGLAANGRNTYRSLASTLDQHKEILEPLVNQVIDLDYIEPLLDQRPKVTVPAPAIDAVLRVITDKPNAYEILIPDKLAKYWPLLREILGEQKITELVDSFIEHAKLADNLAESKFSISLSSLYSRALKADPTPKLAQAILSALRQLSKEEWAEGFRNAPELTDLAGSVRERTGELEIGYNLKDALIDVATRSLAGQPSEITREQCQKLVSILSRDQQELLSRHLRDQVIGTDRDTSPILSLFEGPLTDCSILSEEADKFIREGCPRLFNRKIETELTWLTQTLQNCPQILKQARESSRKDLKDRLKTLEKDGLTTPTADHVAKLRELITQGKF